MVSLTNVGMLTGSRDERTSDENSFSHQHLSGRPPECAPTEWVSYDMHGGQSALCTEDSQP